MVDWALKSNYLPTYLPTYLRPDMTFAVDWALKNNHQPIPTYLPPRDGGTADAEIKGFFLFLFSPLTFAFLFTSFSHSLSY